MKNLKNPVGTGRSLVMATALVLMSSGAYAAGTDKLSKAFVNDLTGTGVAGVYIIGGIIVGGLILHIVFNHIVKSKTDDPSQKPTPGPTHHHHHRHHHHPHRVVKKTS